MDPILVHGATGSTGRLVARALEAGGRAYAISGGDRDALISLSRSLPSRPEVRVVGAGDPAGLLLAFAGMRAVVSTAEPFEALGLPAVSAAVDLGVHYVETRGEQHFQMQMHEQLHRRAIATGATVVAGAVFGHGFGCLGAALLHERCGPLLTTSSYHLVEGLRADAATLRDAAARLTEEPVSFADGKLVPLPRQGAREVRFPGERQPFHAVAIPGGDAVMLPLDIAPLQAATCHLLLPRAQARVLGGLLGLQPRFRRWLGPAGLQRIQALLERRARRTADGERQAAAWKIFVHGQTPSGSHVFVAGGDDLEQASAMLAAQTATGLADGRGTGGGVMTSGRALPAIELLDSLRPHGVHWELR